MKPAILYFYSLSFIAIVLLWGVSLLNGTVFALVRAVWTRKLPGSDFETRYTGLPAVDVPLALLVAFFYTGTAGHNLAYQNFLLNAYATLQPAFVWLYVEDSRFRGKRAVVQR